MANSFGDMLNRIQDETRYTGTAERDIFKLCIKDAIAHYEVERFWWNESRSNTFVTVANQRSYGTAANAEIPFILQFDAVTFTRAINDSFVLAKEDWLQYEEIDPDGASPGIPDRYAYYNQQLWLDPVPNGVYTVRIAGLFKLTALNADADTNSWVTLGEGEEMIRNYAEGLYYSKYTRDDANATRAIYLAQSAYSRLKTSTHRRVGTNQIRPFL